MSWHCCCMALWSCALHNISVPSWPYQESTAKWLCGENGRHDAWRYPQITNVGPAPCSARFLESQGKCTHLNVTFTYLHNEWWSAMICSSQAYEYYCRHQLNMTWSDSRLRASLVAGFCESHSVKVSAIDHDVIQIMTSLRSEISDIFWIFRRVSNLDSDLLFLHWTNLGLENILESFEQSSAANSNQIIHQWSATGG